MTNKALPVLFFLLFLFFLASCARAPLSKREEAMRIVDASDLTPPWEEGLLMEPFLTALERQIVFLEKSQRFTNFQFGKRLVSKGDYLRGLKYFLELLRSHKDRRALWTLVQKEFDFYEVYGGDRWGEVFITSYYEPIIRGSRWKHGPYTQPLYGLPKDLIQIQLSEWKGLPEESPRLIWGRFIRSTHGGALQKVVPYYSRSEIDGKNSLRGKGLELCWVDPLDAFVLQIQGSGVVRFKDGTRLQVGYAAQNGHPYEAVGKFLTDVIPLEEITLHKIEAYLKTLPKKDMEDFLYKNPSYVFFKKLKKRAITYMGVSATGGRTIATDFRFFPKGALGFLSFKKPIFSSEKDTEPVSWEPVARFVLDQDTGGAIRGGGRVDLFWGSGPVAKQAAGVVKEKGKLFYLVPKEVLLSRLSRKAKRSLASKKKQGKARAHPSGQR